MATRATYDICGTVFYCHWDGYPAGSAHRLSNMVAAATQVGSGIDSIADKRGGWAFAFIRGNDDAEPIGSHDDMGGTEWRYTVCEDAAAGLLVTIEACNLSTGAWRTQEAAQPILEFIAQRREFDSTAPRVLVTEPRSWGTPRAFLATIDNAEAIAKALWLQGANFAEGNPNRDSYLARAETWRAAADPVRRAETERTRKAAFAAAHSKAIAA